MTDFTLTEGDDTFPQSGQDNSGADTVLGLGGNDRINAGALADRVEGGDGNDVLTVRRKGNLVPLDADSLFGDAGDDLLVIETTTRRVMVSGDGMVLSGGAGDDTLALSVTFRGIDLSGAQIDGIETLTSTGQVRLTVAQALGFGTIDAGVAALTLTDNADFVFTGKLTLGLLIMADGGQQVSLAGADLSGVTRTLAYFGSDSGDTVTGTRIAEEFIMEKGDDLVMAGGAGRSGDRLDGADGNDTLVAGRGNDTLFGGTGRNELDGGAGDDSVYAGIGADRVNAGRGDDWVYVGGPDTVTGGAGADDFYFQFNNLPPPSPEDTARITDFTVDPASGNGHVDRLLLDNVWYVGGLRRHLTFVGTEEFTAAGQVRVEQLGADTMVYLSFDGITAISGIRLRGVDATLIETADFLF